MLLARPAGVARMSAAISGVLCSIPACRFAHAGYVQQMPRVICPTLFACPADVARMSAAISGVFVFNSRMSLRSCGLRAAHAASDLPDVIRRSSPVLKNIPSSRLTQITGLSPASCSGRGALAIVTNVGMGCGGRSSISARVGVRTSGAVAYGKAVWSRRPDAGVQVPEKQASRG
jgi:hypothetical protein